MEVDLREALLRCQGGRVFVVGDMMLDRVVRGSVDRISPEAPVPVVRYQEEESLPGGACNVAHNLVRLGCAVQIFGMVGDDPQGEDLLGMLAHKGIDFRGILGDRPTTTKTRVVANRHQLLRIDREEVRWLSEDEEGRLWGALEGSLAQGRPSVLVLSDYGKGVCSKELCARIISRFASLSVPVLVDPKGNQWDKYRGAFLVTPNLKELGMVIGQGIPNSDDAVEAAARQVRERFQLGYVMVTRSEMGLSLVGEDLVMHERSSAREVYDVTGAGDTVVAVLASLIGAGVDLPQGARWANRAAGYVVGREGTYAIGVQELLSLLAPEAKTALASWEDAAAVAEAWRSEGKVVVFTNGCFDVLHPGHVRCLRAAKAMGDKLVVGLNSDRSVRGLKGPQRPLNPQWMRAEVLSALEMVDMVVIFDQDTPLELIRAIRPQVLVKGGDYRLEDIVGAPDVMSWGGRVEVVPLLEGVSTTGIIGKARGVDGC